MRLSILFNEADFLFSSWKASSERFRRYSITRYKCKKNRLKLNCNYKYWTLTICLGCPALQSQNALIHVDLNVAFLENTDHNVVGQTGMRLLGLGKCCTQRLGGCLISSFELQSIVKKLHSKGYNTITQIQNINRME